MYERGSHLTGHHHRYQRRKRRRKKAGRILAAALAACLTCLAVFTIRKMPAGEVRAATDKDAVCWPGHSDLGRMSGGPAQIDTEDLLAWIEENAIPVVFLDAGHGGGDTGCAGGSVEEKTINLEIALKVRDQLEERGYKVIMARDTDVYLAKEERVKRANASQADIYVSIHQNAADDGGSASGMEVWYDGSDESRENKRLAQLIRQQTALSTEAVERELRGDADFHVTGSTKMPACLIETGFLTNAKERNKLVTEEYQEQIASGIAQGIEYYFYPKTMYLTFDDGPSRENTEKVLDILKERGIRATFFLVGENVERNPEIAKRIAAEGHTIGIHSNTHDYTAIYADVDSFVQDFEEARRIIYEVTGVDAKLFRFPGGSVNAYNEEVGGDIIDKMTELGYIYYDWNASLGDAALNTTPEGLIANGISTTLGRKKVVMLAHDVVYNTGVCLEELLDSLPEYEMKALSEAVEPIQFQAAGQR
ncbi:MAG: N-acetylmuramoyl-L-alanine amidase [Blautia sp.]|nr:N-acetylmuramoyl-L-alanine amidase [Blautia sp.]MCM1201345.1 N-acetylmuramoyl-L-alanine amidase [Bacteroides fragilis]